MKIKLTVLLAISFLFFSCQKELTIETGDPSTGNGNGNGNGNGSTSGLLIKAVQVKDSDTITTTYSYDNQKRLETMKMVGTTGGMPVNTYKKYERDAIGRIVRILQTTDLIGIPTDTAINLVHYPNATTMEYDYKVHTISLMGFSVVDSTVNVYASGKLTTQTSYMTNPLFGTTPMSTTRIEYTYDAMGRVSEMKMHSSAATSGGPIVPIQKQTYTYGSPMNMLFMTNNAAQNTLLDGMPQTRNDIVVKMQMDDLTGTSPSASFTSTQNYIMGADNKPLSLTQTMTGSQGGVMKTTFYYQ